MALEQLGKYKIIKTQGEGGFGVVYKAEDNIGLIVALKVLHPHIAADEMLAAYFKREAKALARLSHPNIVSIFGYDEIGDVSFIAMQFIEGTTLGDSIAAGERLPLTQVLSIFRQALLALQHAHSKGVVHRDVKPANIMLTGDGTVKIADFGIARLSDTEKLTKTGTGAGSLLYMSPEQIKGKDIDHRSDLYSLGVSLYQVLTGTTPFSGDSDYDIMSKQLNDPPPPLRQLRPDLPVSLENLILKSMSKSKDDRYQSADEMASELTRIQSEIGVETRDPEATVVSRSAERMEATVVSRPPTSGLPWGKIGMIAGALVVVVVASYLVVTQLGEKGEGPTPQEPITEEQVQPETFADSLAAAFSSLTAEEFSQVLAGVEVLAKSASATADQKLDLLKLKAAALVLSGDSSKADREFADLWRANKNTTFSESHYPPAVGNRWKSYQESQRVVPQETTVSIELANWSFFKPVRIQFDGKTESYQGGEATFAAQPRNEPYEVVVLTDVCRFTDTIYVTGGQRNKRVSLSRDQSRLTVMSKNVNDIDELVFAHVYVDGEPVIDRSNQLNCDTPCNSEVFNGPHKVWIKHDNYSIIDGPKYLDLRGDSKVEFRVKPK